MQTYVIVGNGVAGIEAAFAIRARREPHEARIVVVSSETDYFFSRTALMYAYMDRLNRADLEPFERSTYSRQHIELVRGHVVDIDAANGAIALDDGATIAFDKLLLAVGAKPRLLGWPGVQDLQDGLVHFVSMQDLERCERLTWSTESAVVIGGGLIGIELVECLVHHGIRTTFLVREPWFWPIALGKEEGDMVSAHIRAHGVDLRHQEEMVTAHADASGRVCAVETDKGERIECQMLGIAVGVAANAGWLRKTTTPVAVDRGIKVDASFRTSLPNVWAAGDCAEIDVGGEFSLIETIWYSAKLHGRLAAASMLGDEIRYQPPMFYNSSKFMDLEYTTVGAVVDCGGMSLFRKHPTRPISQRIVWDDSGAVIGFNMLGSRWDHTILQRWIAQRRQHTWVREHLREAQFDVEFGRAKIERYDEQELPV